jgi:acyl-CoA thioesterase-1
MFTPRFSLSALCSAFLLALLSGCATQPPAAVSASAPTTSRLITQLEQGTPQTLVLYGTSLTERGAWSRLLKENLATSYPNLVTVHNGAGSGQNSRWGLENLNQRVIAHQPDSVLIEFSINDSVTRFDLSLEESRTNLLAMIDQLQAARPGIEIILQVMNPVIGKPVGDRSHRRDQEAYANVYRTVARERNLRLIDHRPEWNAILKDGGEAAFKRLVRDGVHPSEEANAKIVLPRVARGLGLRLP